ncbi:hypothetical protein RJG79_09685 [Mycoplasmatota bacterium WC44]
MVRKWIAYIIGLTLLGIGIALIIEADVGLGAWDIYFVNLVEASKSNFTIVQSINSLLLVVVSYIIRKKLPNISVLLIILNAAYIGFVIDITRNLLISPSHIILGFIQLVFAVAVVAIGVNISRVTKIILPALDFFNESIQLRTGISFGRVKQIVEFVVMLIGLAIGYIYDLPLRLGLGTIFILISGGLFVNFLYEPIKNILSKFGINPE